MSGPPRAAACARRSAARLIEGARDDALELGRVVAALHGEGLARARLAIGKDRAVETLDGRVNDAARRLAVQHLPIRSALDDTSPSWGRKRLGRTSCLVFSS